MPAVFVITGGICGPSLEWSLDNYGTLTIWGEGEMFEAEQPDDPDSFACVFFEWRDYASDIKKLILEDGVTSISIMAFAYCTNLTDVKIGQTVTSIGRSAFYDCSSLTSIQIPDSVTTIDYSAFDRCSKLQVVTLGAGVTSIGDYAFRGADQLWHVLYRGTIEQWDTIAIGRNNENLKYATRHSNCTGDEITDLENMSCLKCSCWHMYETDVIREPTCTKNGYTVFTCTNCRDSYRTDYTQPKGHSHVPEVTLEPDYENPGVETFTCTDCGHTYTQQLPRLESEVEQTPAISNNLNGHDYSYNMYSNPIYATLAWEDGGYTRVEAIGDVLTVERYNENLQFISRRDIPLELPIFGGVYLCDDYNFVVVGQTNYEEDEWAEVLRVICYTKDWVRVGADSLHGANTVLPFDAGSLRFARSGDALFIRTCHEMFMSLDGKNHQANMTVCVDVPSMKITNSYHLVQNNPFGYVSHSFNQFILVDGTNILTLDHGDAYPRAVVMFRYDYSSGVLDAYGRPQEIHTLPIATNVGIYQHTGVMLGGFEYSDTHYLTAGNSASQDGGIELSDGQRNIFITATSKDDFSGSATRITWITDYDEGSGITLGAPQLIKLIDGRFFLMWAVDEAVNGCFISGEGQLASDVYVIEGALSDCIPIQIGDRLVWYVTDNSAPVFYSIDLNNPGEVTVPHTHTYELTVLAPECTTAGEVLYTCTECNSTFTKMIPAIGHYWSDWSVTVMPTEISEGKACRACAVCGEQQWKKMDIIHSFNDLESAHNYGDNVDQIWVYSLENADQLQITFDERTYLESGWDYLYVYDWNDNLVGAYTGGELAGATILVPGNTVRLQLVSDVSQNEWGFKVTDITNVHLHRWHSWKVSVAPTEMQEGEEYRTCTLCAETEVRTMPRVNALEDLQSEHDYGENADETWAYWIADADLLLVTFDSKTELEFNCDWLYIFDMDDNLVGAYTGDELAGQTVVVPGHTVKLWLVSDYSYQEWGFKVIDITPVFRGIHTHDYHSEMLEAPGCETPGRCGHTCSICSHHYTEEIAATGHSYTSTVTAPTCSEQGYTTHTCAGCDDSYADTYVDALGHSYDDGVVTKEPTCAQEGVLTYTCAICGDTKTESIAKNDVHTYDNGVITTAPTCTAEGVMTCSCIHCDHSYTETISTTSHNFVDGTCADCGASEIALGDINGDSWVDVEDAMLILQLEAMLIEEEGMDLSAADVNGDGWVDVEDAMLILQFDALLIDKFPIEE